MLGNIDAILLGSDGAADGNLHISGCSRAGQNVGPMSSHGSQIGSGTGSDSNAAGPVVVDRNSIFFSGDTAVGAGSNSDSAVVPCLGFSCDPLFFSRCQFDSVAEGNGGIADSILINADGLLGSGDVGIGFEFNVARCVAIIPCCYLNTFLGVRCHSGTIRHSDSQSTRALIVGIDAFVFGNDGAVSADNSAIRIRGDVCVNSPVASINGSRGDA